MKMKYLKSAVLEKDYPEGFEPEVAIAGRSNAGKSSFINTLAGGRIAHVSQQPGKTRLLNFFSVNEKYRLVDMPGYGYAARGGREQKNWAKMIETYISHRDNLIGMILVMDIRRKWTDDEQQLLNFLISLSIPMLVVLNKVDKVKQQERIVKKREIEKIFGIARVFVTSCLKKKGIKEVEDFIYKQWIELYQQTPTSEEDL